MRETTEDGIDHQDYYGLLELDVACDENEIKKAYRRLALRWHPDKNPDNVELAAARFRLIGAAHEVLSDPQERAWYDGHREALLRGETGENGEAAEDEAWDEQAFHDFRSGRAQPSAPGSTSAGLTARHIMRFLDPTLAISLATTGAKADDEGFFGTYRRLFERIAAEDAQAAPYPGDAPSRPIDWPSFGYSHTPYLHRKGEDVPLNQTPVRDFYSAWAGYQTNKSFSWKDGWKLSEAPDRRVKRLMDKENRQAREAARREYNDVVRSLVTFLRKRDPRFKAHLAAQASGAANSGTATPNATPQEMARRREEAMAKRKAELENAYVPQEWAQQAPVEVDSEFETSEEEDSDREDDGEAGEGSGAASADQDDESQEDEADFWECVACDKTFQTRPAWENHERSKKHKTELRRLQREMRKEDKELGLGNQRRTDDTLSEAVAQMDVADAEDASDAEEEHDLDAALGGFRVPKGASAQPQLSKKARQKLKRRQKAGAALDEDGYYGEAIAPTQSSNPEEQADEREEEPAESAATPDVSGTATSADEAAAATPKARKSRRSKKNATAAEVSIPQPLSAPSFAPLTHRTLADMQRMQRRLRLALQAVCARARYRARTSC